MKKKLIFISCLFATILGFSTIKNNVVLHAEEESVIEEVSEEVSEEIREEISTSEESSVVEEGNIQIEDVVNALFEGMTPQEIEEYVKNILEKNEQYQKAMENESVKMIVDAITVFFATLIGFLIFLRKLTASLNSCKNATELLDNSKAILKNCNEEVKALQAEFNKQMDNMSKQLKESKDAQAVLTEGVKALTATNVKLQALIEKANKSVEE